MAALTVSVITINRNTGDTIKRTIASVLGQTYPLQWVVVDGASSDHSLEALRSASRSGDVLISEPDKGISDAFNKGLALATSEAIVFMNAGDEFADPGALERLMTSWDAVDYKWAVGTAEVVTEAGVSLFIRRIRTDTDPLMLVRTECRIFHQATIVRRKVFEEYGGFDLGYRVAMDYDLWLRLIKARVYPHIVDHVVCRYRNGGISSDPLVRWREDCRARQQRGMVNPWSLQVRVWLIVMIKSLLRSWAGPLAFRLKERLRW